MTEIAKCAICGEPMPEGETMFKYHGFNGPCPKPPLAPVLQPHQQRVVDEKTELDKKATALSEFIERSSIFETLTPMEKGLLKDQEYVMWYYSRILTTRISAFK